MSPFTAFVHTSNGTFGCSPCINNSIQGVDIAGKQYKVSLFADDLLLHINNPLVAFPSLIKELELFVILSNFKMNAAKSYCLDVSLPTGTQDSITDKFPFQWEQHSIKYLGVQIPLQLQKLYELNDCPFLIPCSSALSHGHECIIPSLDNCPSLRWISSLDFFTFFKQFRFHAYFSDWHALYYLN